MLPLLGCIADDSTGATDLASMLVEGGMRTLQTIGVPEGPLPVAADAVVVALKSRSIPPDEAVAQSLAALHHLREAGCRQFFFKYCSTFDSTDRGNIGPVAEALMAALGSRFTLACPAFPENGRTVYHGHLFVGDTLLAESGMRTHPLNPMTESDLVRILQRQTGRRVGLLRWERVAAGSGATQEEISRLQAEGVEIAIADALTDEDLRTLGRASAALPLLTGGSGLAIGLPENFRSQGLLPDAARAADLPAVAGGAVVIAGSCSPATLGQVARWCRERPALRIDPESLAAGRPVVREALAWAGERLERGPMLIYSSASPEEVRASQARLGAARAGRLVEQALAGIAHGLKERGAGCFVVAGGEVSGAVVAALGVRALRIGRRIDPGVPWTVSVGGDRPLALALKSGNFGSEDFFEKALRMSGALGE